jgi:hypothetical protein
LKSAAGQAGKRALSNYLLGLVHLERGDGGAAVQMLEAARA